MTACAYCSHERRHHTGSQARYFIPTGSSTACQHRTGRADPCPCDYFTTDQCVCAGHGCADCFE